MLWWFYGLSHLWIATAQLSSVLRSTGTGERQEWDGATGALLYPLFPIFPYDRFRVGLEGAETAWPMPWFLPAGGAYMCADCGDGAPFFLCWKRAPESYHWPVTWEDRRKHALQIL